MLLFPLIQLLTQDRLLSPKVSNQVISWPLWFRCKVKGGWKGLDKEAAVLKHGYRCMTTNCSKEMLTANISQDNAEGYIHCLGNDFTCFTWCLPSVDSLQKWFVHCPYAHAYYLSLHLWSLGLHWDLRETWREYRDLEMAFNSLFVKNTDEKVL